MDKATYLAGKQRLAAEAVAFKREKTCYKCYWLQELCLCDRIKPFATDTRFVILMHPMEAKREKLGTGRVCRATLINSEIIIGLDFTANAEVNALIQDPGNYCMVLYPGEKSINISEDDISPVMENKAAGRRLIVFLIDGTWHCAKKMMSRSVNIQRLPRISFTATHESIFEIKEQPASFCLSTLESIHFFLGEADRRGLESLPDRPQDNLIVVFKSMIDFMQQCALDPSKSRYRPSPKGYSLRKDRKKRKHANLRNIVFMG